MSVDFVLNTLKAALPGEGADLRCIFLAGYLAECGALACPLPEFTACADAFLVATKTRHESWEIFLSTLIMLRVVVPEDLDRYRKYLGREIAAYKAATATPPVKVEPPAEVIVPWPLATGDVVVLNDFASRKTKLAGELDAELLSWTLTAPDATLIHVAAVNAEGEDGKGGGPVVLARAMRGGVIIGSSKPVQAYNTSHRIPAGDKIYVVSPQLPQ